ncbi:hypothetical protein C5167_020490 [Papaver somniferum]|uniref:Protein kinase domain-containing protein n=1 Tax=Papaver somniferum TaxID=3469 RepID=A0A4Y7IV98_PAPSO|nr:hypothetical protein C5167_020490 [Papaver somniferum]
MKPLLLLLLHRHHLFLFLLTITAATFSLSYAQQKNYSLIETEALTSFKLNLHDPLGILSGWDKSIPVCDWRGVVCYQNRVRELRLPRFQLTGKLTDHLSNLTELRKLSLRSNRFNGTIPVSLAKCTRLRALFLQYNSFSGKLPSEISHLNDLQVLNVAQNFLFGEISSDLPLNLRYLDLSSNSFSGEIPKNLSKNTKLQFINLSFNKFSGGIPGNFGSLQQLEYLWLDWNLLEGTLPSALGNCSSLMHLSVQGNAIRGLIPSGFGELPNFKISLSHNNLSGSISSSLFCNVSFNPPSLRIVQLGFNAFTDIVPPKESRFFSVLQVLDLQENQIQGVFPSWLMNISTLTVIDLSRNSFSGTLPIQVGNLLKLEELRVANNSLTGTIPLEIQKCSSLSGEKSLQMLALGANNFSGSIPTSFENLSQLQILNLRKNELTGNVPEEILSLRNLTTLNLSGNKFSGKIPSSIGNLLSLTTLDLSKQNLSGEVPFELPGLPNLQVISLEENNLIGNVPEGLSSLLSLRFLNLSSNQFSGEIPATYGFLRSLLVLSLSKNRISGKIPEEIGNSSELQELDLGENNFTGDIPEGLSEISTLTSLSVDENHLSGVIPSSLSNLTKLNWEHSIGLTNISSLKYFNVSKNNLEALEKECENDKIVNKRKKKLLVLVVVAIAGAFLVSLCCCFYIFSLLRWRKKLRDAATGEKKKSPARGSSGTESRGSGENGGPKLVMFNSKITYAETVEATRQFDEENVLSRGRYGLVFKACYLDGTVLSIRRLPDGSLNEGLFKKEAELLGKVKHRNLTVLRGYYAGPPDVRLLVYDYMPNGNLATLLQEASHQDGHVLNWPMRHLIALGVARGISFLHSTTMVHGDVKPQNVLFDADFEAHLSDFGLDRLTIATSAEASSSTPTVGTLGYVSPKAVLTGEATKEGDVYSFGIVLLELLTGRRPVMFTEDEDIVKWVKKQLQRGQISELLEPGLLELDPESSEWEEFLLGVKVGLLCTAPDPLDRPSMADIVFMLEGCRVGPDIPSSADPTSQPSPA